MYKMNYQRQLHLIQASGVFFFWLLQNFCAFLAENHQVGSTPHLSTPSVYLHSHSFSLFDRQLFFQLTLNTLGSSTQPKQEKKGSGV